MKISDNTKRILLIVTFGIVLFSVLMNFGAVCTALGKLLGLLMPFILGCCIAFILNVPMRFFERRLFKAPKEGKRGRGAAVYRRLYAARRGFSITLTILAVIAVIAVVIIIMIPQIEEAINITRASLSGFDEKLNNILAPIYSVLPELQEWISRVEIDWSGLLQRILGFIDSGADGIINALGSTMVFASSVFSGVFNFVVGLVFAIYILAQKETLGRQVKNIFRAFLPDKITDNILHIASLSNDTFSKFLSGQCIEAVIIGLLCSVGMLIFRMPYAAAIGVLVGFTALIPIIGAFIGTAVGALLILVNDPIKALWFVIFILVLQQLEGNLIYPKVVGNSVGLPSIWVLFAVTIGGSLAGIPGILFSVPLCSTLYCILREIVRARLGKRKAALKTGNAHPEK